MARATAGTVGAAGRVADRTYIGSTVRPSDVPHVHLISDTLGFRSSSAFFRHAIAQYALLHRDRLISAGANDSIEALVDLAEELPGRRAPRLLPPEQAAQFNSREAI